MKNIKNYFDRNQQVYFNHRYGTHNYRNRRKLLVGWLLGPVTVAGLLLLFTGLIMPLIKNLKSPPVSLNSQPVVAGTIAKNEPKKIKQLNPDNTELESVIKSEMRQFPATGQWSVYVYDLKDDSIVDINAGQTHDAASLYKLFMLARLEEKLPYDQWSSTWLVDQNVYDCVYNMLRQDDDPCGEDLAEYLDPDSVDKYNQKNGYKNTRLSGNAGKQTTAREVGRLIVDLKNGQMLSDNARRFIFDALYSQQLEKGIQPGCGDCRTANKPAQLSGAAYDAGVITHGQRSYVLVIMSQGGNFKQISQLTKLVDNYLIKN